MLLQKVSEALSQVKDVYIMNDGHLCSALDALSRECQREVALLAASLRKGQAGDWVRGRVDALSRVQHWFELLKRSENSFDLACKINDLIQCLEQSVEDERSDARPKHSRKKRDAGESRRLIATAQGRADAYAIVEKVLSRLLTVHYPNQQFPLTLTGGSPERTAQILFDALEPLPDNLPQYERALLSQVETAMLQQKRWILVQTKIGQNNAGLVMKYMNRLLRCASGLRILVLGGSAALKPRLLHAFAQATSLADGKPLSDLYRTQECPTHLEENTQICFSTLREVQVLLPTEEQHDSLISPDAFDILVIYGDVSVHAQHMWQRVLCYFQASYCIGFTSWAVESFLPALFEWNVIERQEEIPLLTDQAEPVSADRG
jgi:hypothetical protein